MPQRVTTNKRIKQRKLNRGKYGINIYWGVGDWGEWFEEVDGLLVACYWDEEVANAESSA